MERFNSIVTFALVIILGVCIIGMAVAAFFNGCAAWGFIIAASALAIIPSLGETYDEINQRKK